MDEDTEQDRNGTLTVPMSIMCKMRSLEVNSASDQLYIISIFQCFLPKWPLGQSDEDLIQPSHLACTHPMLISGRQYPRSGHSCLQPDHLLGGGSS